jgi:GNAT superfamily N-acetyltransferase
MQYPFLDLELAREIELAEAAAATAGAELMKSMLPQADCAVESIAGGYAVYCGADSPVTQAVGLGLADEVTAEEFDRLEQFYFSRGEPVRVETCPLAHASLMKHYRERSYFVSEFTSVMIRPVDVSDGQLPDNPELQGSASTVQIHKVPREEIDLWTLTVAQGFSENFPVTQEILTVMKMFALGRNTECLLATVDGRVAGGATLAVRGRIAGFFGASTLPEFRKRGVQTALLRERMKLATTTRCELAVSLARPGSPSERNIIRQGFRSLYTRVKFEKNVVKEQEQG